MKQSKTMKHSKIVTTIIATVLGVFLVGGLTIQAAPGDMIRKSAFSQEGLQTQRLMIQDAGTYVLTGSMHGTIYVDPGIGDVRLILDNARIEGGQEPAIMAVSGNSLHIEPKAGTVNMLSQNGKEAPIYSSVNTTFDGPGQLQIQGQGQYGVRMENAHLTVNAGNYFVQANNTGLGMTGNQPGNIAFNGGNVFVNAQDPVQHGANVSYNGGQVHQATAADMVPSGQNQGQIPSGQGQTPSDMGQGQIPSDMETQSSTDTAGQIVEGITTNSAADLEADYENIMTR